MHHLGDDVLGEIRRYVGLGKVQVYAQCQIWVEPGLQPSPGMSLFFQSTFWLLLPGAWTKTGLQCYTKQFKLLTKSVASFFTLYYLALSIEAGLI